MIEPDEDILKNPHAMALWRECVCLFAVEHEECGVHIIGNVFKHYLDDDKRFIHVLVSCGDAEHLRIKREDVAHVLLKWEVNISLKSMKKNPGWICSKSP